MTCCRKLYWDGFRKRNLLKYRYILFNQPTSQVVLNPGDILVVNTNWWFHETKVLQESLNSNALFGFKPRCFLENSVSQWLVSLIRSTSQAAGLGMIVIIHQHGSAGQNGIQFVLIKCEGVSLNKILNTILLGTWLGEMHKIVRSVHLHSLGPSCFIRHVCTSVFHNRHHACVWYCIIRKRVS